MSIPQPVSPSGLSRWAWVLATVGIVIGVGFLGVFLIALAFIFGGEPSSTRGDTSTEVTGGWGWIAILGVLLVFLSFIAFIPALIISIVQTRPKAFGTSATSNLPSTPSGRSLYSSNLPPNAPKSVQRWEQSRRGRNMLGLAGRKSNRVGWIGLSVFGGLLGLFFLMMFIPFLLPVYMVGIFGFVGWAFWRGTNLFGGTNNDIAVYAKYFAEQDPETQQLGKQSISTRSGDTEETSYPVDPKNPHTRLASFLPGPPLGEILTTQMWKKHGEGIMGREIAMMTLAKEAGVPLTPWVQTGQALEYPVPTALVDAGKNAEFYQQRNLINLDDPIYPVNIVDLVLFGRVIQNNKPVLSTLQTFTYLETWFPSDHWLTLYPKTRTSLNRWGGLGEEIEATARQFNKVFDVQTDDTNWARLVLNPAVMKTLIYLAPLRFTVDAGRIVLHTHNGWLAVSEAKKYVGVLRDIARSVRAAETG